MSRLEKLRANREETPLVYSRTEKEREPLLGLKGWATAFVILFLLGLLGYLLFFSHFFDVKKVEVVGYQNVSKVNEAVASQGDRGPLGNNIILFNKDELKEALSGDPTASDVYIKKIFPNKIKVEITESKPSLIWSTRGENYLVDERGAVLGLATNQKLPQVFDSADIAVKRGDKIASPTFIKFINTVWNGFEPATETKISKIIIFDLLTDVHVLSSSGWTVYLDASKDAGIQMENLTKVIGEAAKTKTKLEYIDLRLDTKAFYK